MKIRMIPGYCDVLTVPGRLTDPDAWESELYLPTGEERYVRTLSDGSVHFAVFVCPDGQTRAQLAHMCLART